MIVEVEPWLETLRELGTTDRAENEKRYLKSAITHLGVTVPDTRKVARKLCRDHPDLDAPALVDLTEALWQPGIYELRSLAVFVLEIRRGRFDEGAMAFFESTLRACGTWALLDTLAIAVVGDVVYRAPGAKSALARWARDDDFWLRRSSLLALLGEWRRSGFFDEERFASFAVPMLEEKEFFVRKAIGWVLRDLSKKAPTFPATFLVEHRQRVSGLTLREGAKYLSTAQRTALGLPSR